MNFATPHYYTNEQPTRPGWYFGKTIQGQLTYLYWRNGAFWNDGQQVEVEYHAPLPEFIEQILNPTCRP